MVLQYLKSLLSFDNLLIENWDLNYWYNNWYHHWLIEYITHPNTISYIIILTSYYSIFKLGQISFFMYKNPKKYLMKIPILRDRIYSEIKKNTKGLEIDLNTDYLNYTELPEHSYSNDELQAQIKNMKSYQKDKKKISGIIYHGELEHLDKLGKIFNQFVTSNPLHPDIFPEIREMEIDIINMTKHMYKGDNECCGNLTYGGTESLLLACLTYRDYFKEEKGITKPNIVCFNTVHPAIDKAGHYFNIEIRKVNVKTHSNTGSVNNIKKMVNNNTILIIGSAPSYPHGIIDPIIEMSNLALERKVGFHLDACMGGFLLPFLDNFTEINFKECPGITSISLDTHKYGYSLKGSSVLLIKSWKYKKYQHFIQKDWNGGIYATPTMMGSKSGALIASTWASMLYTGKNEYTRIAKQIQDNVNLIKDTFSNNNIVSIVGEPNLNIIGMKCRDNNKWDINIYHIIEKMKEKEWNLTIMQKPASFHFCLTKLHTIEICQKFIQDLKDSINKLKNENKNERHLTGSVALYGSSQGVKEGLFIEEVIHDFLFLLTRNKIIDRY
mgnify:CR=1 FL=1